MRWEKQTKTTNLNKEKTLEMFNDFMERQENLMSDNCEEDVNEIVKSEKELIRFFYQL